MNSNIFYDMSKKDFIYDSHGQEKVLPGLDDKAIFGNKGDTYFFAEEPEPNQAVTHIFSASMTAPGLKEECCNPGYNLKGKFLHTFGI
ncbi:hypothetical protein CN380_18935 [Bacillus sp. AFS017274]|nr:hypothetical protein CN380_18935 [Bacillus sp. AFS017274]